MRRSLLALPFFLLACNKGEVSEAPVSAGTAAAQSSAPAQGLTVTGTVSETMDAGGYTYLKLATAEGERWAAVTQTPVKVGQKTSVVNAVVMSNFHSPTLNRTFENILFGVLGTETGSIPPAAPGAAPKLSDADSATVAAAHGARQHEAVALGTAIERAPGADGHTVAELHAKKGALTGKTVAVRGKVARYNSGILGLNWVHLQDGSGSAEQGDHDILVTTNAETAVGQIVLVRGKLATDKDFGAGYEYAVLVEDATLEK